MLFPTPKERHLELLEPTKYVAKLQEAAAGHRSHFAADRGAVADLQRVLQGRRRHGAPGLRELRRAGRLRATGSPRHLGEGRYRHCALRRRPGVASSRRSLPNTAPSAASSTPIPGTTATSKDSIFPTGPYRPIRGVQRGSVMDTEYPGDPLTPGVGATKDAKRLPITEAKTITAIPVLPISYGDAQPLLAALKGPVAPERLARRAAHHLSRRPGSGEGAPGDEVELGHQDHLRRHRQDSRQRDARPMGDSRQSPRCLGERRGRSGLGHGGRRWKRRARWAS